MTIKELETNLGVPRANIRFYEKEGLLSPKREENGYRDYSPEDYERLKKILILRKIGIPVSEIADLFDGAASLPDVLEQNLANLGFYDEIVAWIMEQNAQRNFPSMNGGRIRSIVPTLTAYPIEVGSDAARYQIQLRVTYKRQT